MARKSSLYFGNENAAHKLLRVLLTSVVLPAFHSLVRHLLMR
jgi:hypothetical protein